MSSNVYEQLLQVCEQLLTNSALPQDLLQKYYSLKWKKLSSVEATQFEKSSLAEKNAELQNEVTTLKNKLSHMEAETIARIDQIQSHYESKMAQLQKKYEEAVTEAKQGYKLSLEQMQINFDSMVFDAKSKIERYEKENEFNNVLFAKLTEFVIPFMEEHQYQYTSSRNTDKLNDKEILIDFIMFLLMRTQDDQPMSGKKSPEYSPEKPIPPPLPKIQRTSSEKKGYQDMRESLKSPHFKTTEASPPKPTQNSSVKEKKDQYLNSLYDQLKNELELSKQTLREFQQSRSNLQSALKESQRVR